MLFKLVHNKEIHMLCKQVNYEQLLFHIRTTFKKLPKSFSLAYHDKQGDAISVSNQADLDIIYEANLPIVRIIISEVLGQPEQSSSIVRKSGDGVFKDSKVDQAKPIESLQKKEYDENQHSASKNSKQLDISHTQIARTINTKIEELIPELTKKLTEQMKKSSTQEKQTENNNSAVHAGITCDGCKTKPVVGIRYKCSICPDYDFCEKCQNDKYHPHAFLKIRNPTQAPPLIIASMDSNLEVPQSNSLVDNVKNIFQSFMPNANCSKDKIQRRRYGKLLKKYFQRKDNDEEEKQQVKKQSPQVTSKSQEKADRQLALAYELEQILNIDFLKVLRFVQRHPDLSKQQLIEAYYSGSRIRR